MTFKTKPEAREAQILSYEQIRSAKQNRSWRGGSKRSIHDADRYCVSPARTEKKNAIQRKEDD
jgi:hypothetical protein